MGQTKIYVFLENSEADKFVAYIYTSYHKKAAVCIEGKFDDQALLVAKQVKKLFKCSEHMQLRMVSRCTSI